MAPGGAGFGRTAALTGLALAVILGALGLVAHGCDSGYAPPTPLTPYLRQGPRGGAAALQRDLLAGYPAGSAVTPLVSHLQAMGFDCAAVLAQAEPPACVARVNLPGRELARISVVVRDRDGAVVGIEPAIAVAAP